MHQEGHEQCHEQHQPSADAEEWVPEEDGQCPITNQEEAGGKDTHNHSKEHEQEAGQTGCTHPQPLNKDIGKDEGMDLTGMPSKHDAKELGKDEDVDLIG